MIPQAETPTMRSTLTKTNPEVPRIAHDEARAWTRTEIKETARDMELLWIQSRQAILLVGAASMLAPTALTLLLVAMLLPLSLTQIMTMLLASSVLFYAVVELAWRGRQALVRAPLKRLRERFEREPTLAKPIAQV